MGRYFHFAAALFVFANALPHQTWWQATALFCVAAAALDLGQGANWASIVDVGGLYAGTAAGLINMVGNMGNAFQPWIGDAISNAHGWTPVFAAYACSYLCAASMWIFIDPTRPFTAGRSRD